jgi:hypothetical protein
LQFSKWCGRVVARTTGHLTWWVESHRFFSDEGGTCRYYRTSSTYCYPYPDLPPGLTATC